MEFDTLSSNNKITSLNNQKESPNRILHISQWYNYFINIIAILLHYTNYICNRFNYNLQKILLVKNDELHKLRKNIFQSHTFVWLKTNSLKKDPFVFFNIPYVLSIFILDIIESFRKKTVFLFQTILLLTFPILMYRVHKQISFAKGYEYLPYIIWGEKPIFSLKNTDFSRKVFNNQIIYIQKLKENSEKTIKDHILLEPIKSLKDNKRIALSQDMNIYQINSHSKGNREQKISFFNNKQNNIFKNIPQFEINNKNFDNERLVDMWKNIYLAQRFSIFNITTKIKDEWQVIDTSLLPTSYIQSASKNFPYKTRNHHFLFPQPTSFLSIINNFYVAYIQPYQFNPDLYNINTNRNNIQYYTNIKLRNTNTVYKNITQDSNITKPIIKTEKNHDNNLLEQDIEIDPKSLIKSDTFNSLNSKIKIFQQIKKLYSYGLEIYQGQLKFIAQISKWLTKRHHKSIYLITSSRQSPKNFFSTEMKIEKFFDLLDSKRNKWRYKTIEWVHLYNSHKTKNFSQDEGYTSNRTILEHTGIRSSKIDFWHYNKCAIINPFIAYLRQNTVIKQKNILMGKYNDGPYFWSAIKYPFENNWLDIWPDKKLENHTRYSNDHTAYQIEDIIEEIQGNNKKSFIKNNNIFNIFTKVHLFPKEFLIPPFLNTKIGEKYEGSNFLHSVLININLQKTNISDEEERGRFPLNVTKVGQKIDQVVTTNTKAIYPIKNSIASDIITYLFKTINQINQTNIFDNKKLLYIFSNPDINENYYKDIGLYRKEERHNGLIHEGESFLNTSLLNPSQLEITKAQNILLGNKLTICKEPIKFSQLYNKFSNPFLSLPISVLEKNSILNHDFQNDTTNIIFSSKHAYVTSNNMLLHLENKKKIDNALVEKRGILENKNIQAKKSILQKYNQWFFTTQWWDFHKKFISNAIPTFQISISDKRTILLRPILEKIIRDYSNLQQNLRDKIVIYYNNHPIFSNFKSTNEYLIQELYQGTQSVLPIWETLSLYKRLDSRDFVVFAWFVAVCIIYYHWIPFLTGLTYIHIWYQFEKMFSFARPSWNNLIRILVHNSLDSGSQQIRLKMYVSRGWMIWLQSEIWSYLFGKTFLSNYLLHTRSIDLPRRKKNLVVNSLITQKSLLINYTLSNSNQSIYNEYASLGESQNYEGLIFFKKWAHIFYRNPYFSKYQRSLSSEFQWLTDLFFNITSGSNILQNYDQLYLFNRIQIPKKLPETTITTKRWLLIGAPETGKSYLVKNIAANGHFPLVHISLKDIRHATPDLKYNKLKKYNKWIKQLADRGFLLDNILELAKMLSPCILWISDLHEFHAKHNIRHQQGKIYDASLLLTILLKIMGNDLIPERRSNITLVGSSHSPGLLDPKFVSRHRLDLIVNLRKPSFIQRQKIFANLLHSNQLNIQGNRAFYELGSNSIGYSLRDITGLVNEILLIKSTKNTKLIDTDTVRLAIYRQISKQSANNTLVAHDALQYKIGRALVQSTLVVPKPIFPITLRHDLWKTRFYYLSNAFLEFTIEKSTVTELITLTHIVNCLAGSAARDAFISFFHQLSVSTLGITKQLKHDLSIASSILQALFLEFPMRDITFIKNRKEQNILADIRGKYNSNLLEKTASSLNFFNRFTSYIYWSYRIQRLSLSWTLLFDNIQKRNKHMILESSEEENQDYNESNLLDQYIDRHLPYERRVIKRQQKRTKKINYSFHEMVLDSQLKSMGLPWVSEYILDYDALQLSILLLETRPIWNPPALNPSYSILFFDRDLVISRNMLTKVYMTYGEKFQSEKLNPKRIKKQILWPDATIHNTSINDRTTKLEDHVQSDLPNFANFRKMAKANAQLEQSQLQVPVYLYQGWTGLDHQDSLHSYDLLHHRSLLINKDLRDRELLIYGTLLDIYNFLLKFFIEHHSLLLDIEKQLIMKGVLNREDIEKVLNDKTL